MRSGQQPLVALALWLATASSPAVEIAPRDARSIAPPAASTRSERVIPGNTTSMAAAAQRFLDRLGGTWIFDFDPRTRRATLVQGSGIPLVPGRGNRLGPEVLTGVDLADGELTVDALEPLARAFIRQNADLLAPPTGRLELDRVSSSSRDGGRLHSLYFEWLVGDVPVETARVFVRLNSGNITQFGAPLVGPVEVDVSPVLDGPKAERRVFAWSGDSQEIAQSKGEPRLILQPEEAGATLRYRLVWVVTYRMPGEIETWEARIDARTGDVVGFRDINRYGRAEGGVYPRTVTDAEIRVPLPYVSAEGETPVLSDTAGAFAHLGGAIVSGLDGPFFTTTCEACSAPAQALVNSESGFGRIDFGLGGVDEVGNGRSTLAERNAFYHMNQVRRFSKKWLALPWFDSNVGVRVNVQDTCNAVWTAGEANFFRSGNGCNNTGEISDVVYHEWAHGLDENTRPGDGATGEATADIVSMHLTHSALIGPYFKTTGEPVRNLDQLTTPKGLLTTSNIGTHCPVTGFLGPLGYEIHCEGEIYGQAAWDLAQALISVHGYHTGWRTSERIFFNSLADSGSYLPGGSFPVYDAYVNADDDDGNLMNGTPNGSAIFNAFDAHGIAGSTVTSSADCTRPAQPALAAVPDCDSVDLSWNSIPGVNGYTILKSELRDDRGFFHVADVTAAETTFSDTEVAPGIDYHYVVLSFAADGCESTVENPVHVSLTAQPVLNARAVAATDDPQGNRSGFADPGETVDLVVTLENAGTLDSTSVTATLTSSTPGVTLLSDTDGWPAISVGSEADNTGVLRFETNDQVVECGDTLRFELAAVDTSLCLSENSFLDVPVGDRTVTEQDDFEIDRGWSHDSVNSTATTGGWTLGDPDGTTFQPENDVTEPGTQAWFTAPNAGGLGSDDVDGGEVILLSPTYDLSGQTKAILSYHRWFGNRDIGEDAGDFFAVDVNDGTGWVNLETLGNDRSAAYWTYVEFALHDFVALTSSVQFRFRAADGPAADNLIEAAVDEIRIDEPLCDLTPACFAEPTFSGLQSATPGSSCARVDLSWQAAASNCVDATISYNIYRATTAGLVPSAVNLVASGVTATSYVDDYLEPGTTYHYIVRADDSRSGEDGNTVELSAIATVTPDIVAPMFAGLETLSSGTSCGEIELGWSAAQDSCSEPVTYHVYRSTDPAFAPGPSNLVGSTLSAGFVDAALTPGAAFTYLVRAADALGNEDINDVRLTTGAGATDLTLLALDFEPDDGGWMVVDPNDALTGHWEWGDPEGTESQPEDDHTPAPGVNAWVTGLLATLPEGRENDIDFGTTTLQSPSYDLSTTVNPAVRYARWYVNELNGIPGADTFLIEVDGGLGWMQLEQVPPGEPPGWVEVEIPLGGLISTNDRVKFRFTARDLEPVLGTKVEACVDDFRLVDAGQGCVGCALPVPTVDTVVLDRIGDDVVLDWSSEPVSATRYVVYKLEGSSYGDAVSIGSTGTTTFVHTDAGLSGADFFYRVTAVDACGNESGLQ